MFLELNQRAHSPQLAAGLASEPYKMVNSLQSKIPCSLLQGASIAVATRTLHQNGNGMIIKDSYQYMNRRPAVPKEALECLKSTVSQDKGRGMPASAPEEEDGTSVPIPWWATSDR